MKLETTPIKDLYVLHRNIQRDERGSFTRLFGEDEMKALNRPSYAAHVNTSTSAFAGTLRGIHFQYPPFSESKIVACTSGAIWDVGIDLRPKSSTKFMWFAKTLTPENGLSMVIPEGFGHAFITLEPNSTAVYVVSQIYAPDHESGIQYNDPKLSIDWPITPKIISKKDQKWGLLDNRLEELNDRFSSL